MGSGVATPAQVLVTSIQDLGALGVYGSEAKGINATGYVVGWSNGGHAFLWTEQGGMVDLAELTGSNTIDATDINDQGQVVGVDDVSNHAFLWTEQGGVVILEHFLLRPLVRPMPSIIKISNSKSNVQGLTQNSNRDSPIGEFCISNREKERIYNNTLATSLVGIR